MSDMDVKEAYSVLQANCGIEVGDKVKIVREFRKGEFGFAVGYNPDMTRNIGKTDRVKSIGGNGGYQVCGWTWPFFCLELVEKTKPELPPITVGGHTVAFLDDRIRICDISVRLETLKEMVKRLEGQN